MNTPSNAGKELKCPCCHRPVRLHRWDESEPTSSAKIQCIHGDCLYPSTGWRNTPEAAIEAWNRRTTPQTQSQEGETVDYSAPTPETDAFMSLIDDSEIDLGQVEAKLKQFESERNAAQRENDRLKSEVAELRREVLSVIEHIPKEYRVYVQEGSADDILTASLAVSVAKLSHSARAATEEGKRG